VGEDEPTNGLRYLPRSWAEEHQRQHAAEWERHRVQEVAPMVAAIEADHEDNAARIDRMEQKWDRLLGVASWGVIFAGIAALFSALAAIGVFR